MVDPKEAFGLNASEPVFKQITVVSMRVAALFSLSGRLHDCFTALTAGPQETQQAARKDCSREGDQQKRL